MRTIYVDLVELDQSGALGLISSKVRILPAGAVIRTEQAEIRAEVPQYQEMAERAGVFFFFEDEELPELPFFAVPDRKSTRLNSSHPSRSRMPSSA